MSKSVSSLEWNARIHKQHQDEDKKLEDTKVRYNNRDSKPKDDGYGSHRVKRERY